MTIRRYTISNPANRSTLLALLIDSDTYADGLAIADALEDDGANSDKYISNIVEARELSAPPDGPMSSWPYPVLNERSWGEDYIGRR